MNDAEFARRAVRALLRQQAISLAARYDRISGDLRRWLARDGAYDGLAEWNEEMSRPSGPPKLKPPDER